jgi:chlorite dismutase
VFEGTKCEDGSWPIFPPVPLTLEGSSVLHQFFRFDWKAWRPSADGERKKIVAEAIATIEALERTGASAPVRRRFFRNSDTRAT